MEQQTCVYKHPNFHIYCVFRYNIYVKTARADQSSYNILTSSSTYIVHDFRLTFLHKVEAVLNINVKKSQTYSVFGLTTV